MTDAIDNNWVYNFRICEKAVTPCGTNENTTVCQKYTPDSAETYSLGTIDSQVIMDYRANVHCSYPHF